MKLFSFSACMSMKFVLVINFLTQIMDIFSCSPKNTLFYIGKICKRLPANPDYAEIPHTYDMVT